MKQTGLKEEQTESLRKDLSTGVLQLRCDQLHIIMNLLLQLRCYALHITMNLLLQLRCDQLHIICPLIHI